MKKKRILYSELAPASPPAAAPSAVPAAPTVEAAAAPAPQRAPVDLARALAAARAAEARQAAPTGPSAADTPRSAAAPGAPAAAAPKAPVGAAPVTAASARSLREQARARKGRAEILLFRVANEQFGIDLGSVEEAIDLPPVHHVPEMPPAMLGVVTVRGVLTSVYSPSAALGVSLHDGTSALIFRRGRARVAVVVDEVDDVTTLDLTLLRDAPMLDAGDGIVLGVVRQQDTLLALVDSDALIAACQAASLLETA